MASYNVAEAKRHFSELIDRVSDGERILIARRGTPVMALVPPDEVSPARPSRPVGLAAAAGALSDWQGLDDLVSEIYAARDQATDRAVPRFD
ncbi:MAG: type II toxin-antitoxin system prevent-host-death family antitoxin [Spirochaetaceae bacterium]|nr:type II toxin-antitoxin system prevent-host-death family antitoxin [Spirochaetaceae bacterium]